MSETLQARTETASYSDCVNPQWVRLLDVLQMNVRYRHCQGAELFTEDGRRILDFLSGYSVHVAGHNHPDIVLELKEELDRSGPAMLQSHVPELAGDLASELCRRAGGAMKKVFFCSSGSEGIEAAIKFARANTGRGGLLAARGAFHGLTCGALSLMDDPFWSGGFGDLLPETRFVPFGDLVELEKQLATKRFAAFFLEPIQSEAGVKIPEPGYLRSVQSLCRRFGTLLVMDEVQTGMYRTGPFLAGQPAGVDPDMIVMAKALSGGLVPVGAVLMTDPVYSSVYNSLQRSIVHTSTFSENGLSMRAGLATLGVIDRERLPERCEILGQRLREGLRSALSGYEMIKEVRGAGLMNGIEFTAPRSLALRIPFTAFKTIHPGMFGQIVVMRLYRDHGMLTQMCGNNFMVLKACPPLVAEEEHVDRFIDAMRAVVDLMHNSSSFWTEALGLARRVVNV